jgi:hypothetical protein
MYVEDTLVLCASGIPEACPGRASRWEGGSLPILHILDYAAQRTVPKGLRIIRCYVQSIGGQLTGRVKFNVCCRYKGTSREVYQAHLGEPIPIALVPWCPWYI